MGVKLSCTPLSSCCCEEKICAFSLLSLFLLHLTTKYISFSLLWGVNNIFSRKNDVRETWHSNGVTMKKNVAIQDVEILYYKAVTCNNTVNNSSFRSSKFYVFLLRVKIHAFSHRYTHAHMKVFPLINKYGDKPRIICVL